MVTVSPGEEVFARNRSKTRDLTAPAARESENSFELKNNDDQAINLGGGEKTWSLKEFPAKR